MIAKLSSSFTVLLLCAGIALAAEGQRRGGGGKSQAKQPTQNSTCNDVPAHAVDVILGRPTANSITASVLVYPQDAQGYIAFGTQRGKLTQRTPLQKFKKGEPLEVVIGNLQPDTHYFYQLHAKGIETVQGEFQTQRRPGDAFKFTITADSHLDDRVSAPTYLRTLANAAADAPDFNVDLGDTFMTEKHESRDNAARQYLAQRYYFGQLCRSAGLFLTLGNHDGESPRGRGDRSESLAVWSNTMRKRYFPNPVPDDFYTGNAAKHPEAGLLQDYFAWQWGDALFVVLDPFWYTEGQRSRSDNWKHTLGKQQYDWLKSVLEGSHAALKFVFIHHLVGGADSQCRGGAEAVPLYEWGGKSADGSDGFQQNRTGWPAPVHQLLLANHVSAVFHGHDHFYAKQDVDGIVYQEVPQPGTPGSSKPRTAAEYGYLSGVILGSPGHLRVSVSPAAAKVEYIRAVLPGEEQGDRRNAAVGHSYVIAAYGTDSAR